MKEPETKYEKEAWLKKELVGHKINEVKVFDQQDGSESIFFLSDDRTIQLLSLSGSRLFRVD